MAQPILSVNEPAPTRAPWHYHAAFAALSLILTWFIYAGAVTGRDLLAPLDLGPIFNPTYKWVNPDVGKEPANHYESDIYSHELPRQFAIYQALRRGEFPWWEPYTQNGRPLVADAHISGTDPIRLGLYCFLPFETAYNWSKIIPTLLCGLGAYLLLRRLGFMGWIAVFSALAYQFAANHFEQTPLSVLSSFAYYALLWWAWDSLVENFRGWLFALSAWLAASIFLAGNQQSHAYFALFTMCFLVGYGLKHRAVWRRLLVVLAGSWVVGCLIALPILVAQVELFRLCTRVPSATGYRLEWLTGLCNLTAVFPWLTGTFKTIDAAKVFDQYAVGFHLYLGSVALALAAGGVALYFVEKITAPFVRTALLLTATYEFICLTPLLRFLYTRASDLACLGLTILCAYAVNQIFEGTLKDRARSFIRGACLAAMGFFIAANIGALVVYPRIQSRLENYILHRDQAGVSFPSAPEFRRIQIANFPGEISFRNPETLAAVAGAIGLFLLLRPGVAPLSRRRALCGGLLALNLVAPIMFDHRFTVRSPVPMWDRLLHADSDQFRAAEMLGLQYRLEEPTGYFSQIFPAALPILYRAHLTTTYSSFGLPDVARQIHQLDLNLATADARIDAPEPGKIPLQLDIRPPSSGTSRFQWSPPIDRQVKVVEESLNEITIEVAAGAPGRLIRTDRYYPGWRLVEPAGLQTQLLGNALLAVEIPASSMRLTFRYTPTWLPITWRISVATLAAIMLTAVVSLFRRRRMFSSNPVNPVQFSNRAGA